MAGSIKVLADSRGFGLLFKDEVTLGTAIEALTELKAWKREHGSHYPAVYIHTTDRLSREDIEQFHDEIWWMGFAVEGGRQPMESGGAPRDS